jgi:hypothetical protein
MSEKLTPWFPADVKPVRNGVYEVESRVHRAFAYWNGERFGWRCWELPGLGAEEAAIDAFHMRRAETCLEPRVSWRGLAKEPK